MEGDESGWRWINVNGNGLTKEIQEVNEGLWGWMKANVGEWMWTKINESKRWWMKVTEDQCRRMSANAYKEMNQNTGLENVHYSGMYQMWIGQ